MLRAQVDQRGRPDLGQRLRRPRPVALRRPARQRGRRPRERAVGLVQGPPADDGETAPTCTGIEADDHRAGRLPHGRDQGRGRHGRARLPGRGQQRRQRSATPCSSTRRPARRSTAGRWCTTRSTASSTRPPAPRNRTPSFTRCGRRATRSPAPSTRTSGTWSTPPASPTGSTRTPSAATPTTARAHTMTTVNNDPRISCPNANWNGVTTNYCNGVTSDDVVSHEWGHAYTEYTSGLIYQWQSGALNESYSDIWGETIDLINGREDEGEDDSPPSAPTATAPRLHPRAVDMRDQLPRPASPVRAPRRRPRGASRSRTTGDHRRRRRRASTPADAAGPTTTDGCSRVHQRRRRRRQVGLRRPRHLRLRRSRSHNAEDRRRDRHRHRQQQRRPSPAGFAGDPDALRRRWSPRPTARSSRARPAPVSVDGHDRRRSARPTTPTAG